MSAVPVAARLLVAAALCIVPLGLVWSQSSGSVTPGIVGPPVCNADGYCEPGIYTPGVYVPGVTSTGAQSPARVLLVPAIALLVFVASRLRTRATLRLARLATGAVAVAFVLAASQRATLVLCCLAGALVLLTATVRRPPDPALFESRHLTR